MSDEPKWWWSPARRRAYEEDRRRRDEARREEDARRRADDDNAALGYVMGITTGIPVPFSSMAVMGAALHHSINSTPSSAAEPTRDYTPPSPSYDSGLSSSYDSGSSSSSSYDSGSSSSSGGYE